MIDLVLDDLRGETSECGMALAELAIRIRDLNALEADRAALAFERQAAFGGVVGAVFRSDRSCATARSSGVLSASVDGWLKNGMDVMISRCM